MGHALWDLFSVVGRFILWCSGYESVCSATARVTIVIMWLTTAMLVHVIHLMRGPRWIPVLTTFLYVWVTLLYAPKHLPAPISALDEMWPLTHGVNCARPMVAYMVRL